MFIVDIVILRSMIEDSGVSATLMKTDCVQFRQSVRPNRTVSCLGTNMKDYATCEHCMDYSLHPRLREYSSICNYTFTTYPEKITWDCC